MVANIRGYTPNYGFKLVNFDTPRWHTLEYANWNQLDAILQQAGIAQVRGEWLNSTLYLVGDRVFDNVTNDVFRCQVEHTSPATGTFEEYRTNPATSDHWTLQMPGVPVYRGAWVAGATYSLGDIVSVDDYTYYLCTNAHTSAATFPADAAYWQLLFDGNEVVGAAEAARDAAAASAYNAGVSEVNAATSEAAALLSANNALTYANASQASANASALSASAALTSETNSANSAAAADASADSADVSEANALASAIEAANQADALHATSATTNSISEGVKTFQTQANKKFVGGSYVTILDVADPLNRGMAGMVTSYSGTTLEVFITQTKGVTGSGPNNNWMILVSGADGVDGPAGDPGLIWRGAWSSVADYVVHDGVHINGNSYIAVAPNTNSQPPSANWNMLAQGGTTIIADDQITPPMLNADNGAGQLAFRDRLNFASREGDIISGILQIDRPTGLALFAKGLQAAPSTDLNLTYAVLSSANGGYGAWSFGGHDTSPFDAWSQAHNTGGTLLDMWLQPLGGVVKIGPSKSEVATKEYVDAADSAVIAHADAGDAANTALANGKVTKTGDKMTGGLALEYASSQGATLTLNSTIAGGGLWQIAASGGDHGTPGGLVFYSGAGGARFNLTGAGIASFVGPVVSYGAVGTDPSQLIPKAYADTKLPISGGSLTGPLLTAATASVGAISNAAASTGGVQVLAANNVADAAYMAFHRQGSFAAYFGIDTDNQWKVGGWSMGAVAHKLWHDGNVSRASVADYRANYGPAANNVLTIGQVWASAAQVGVPDAAAVTMDFNAAFDFIWVVGAAGRTMNNPINLKNGQKGTIILYPGVGGASVTTWGSYWCFPNGVKPTQAIAGFDILTYFVYSDLTHIFCTFGKSYS